MCDKSIAEIDKNEKYSMDYVYWSLTEFVCYHSFLTYNRLKLQVSFIGYEINFQPGVAQPALFGCR